MKAAIAVLLMSFGAASLLVFMGFLSLVITLLSRKCNWPDWMFPLFAIIMFSIGASFLIAWDNNVNNPSSQVIEENDNGH